MDGRLDFGHELRGRDALLVAGEVAEMLRVTPAWVYAETRAKPPAARAAGPVRAPPPVRDPRLAGRGGEAHRAGAARMSARRAYGTGRIYTKHGAG